MSYPSLRWLPLYALPLHAGLLALGCTSAPPLITPDASVRIDANIAPPDGGSSCENGIRDNDESQVDCGGATCEPCPDGASCVSSSDCRSRVCDRGYCLTRSCEDGVRNGPEVGVDCGGDCGLCRNGETCSSSGECQSGHCRSSMCVPAECDDGRRNGGESDTDCGGPTCAHCGPGLACAADNDCVTLRCVDGTCAVASCSDRIQNQDETSVDCGGAVCAPCADGLSCEFHLDCGSRRCHMGGCVSCNDGVRNADEVDIDCGGTVCDACRDGKMCVIDGDCASGRCVDGLCISCSDGVQNSDESDVDCGGTTCDGCADGEVCTAPSDCASGQCAGGLCISCSDGIQNALETDVDCGGGVCLGCDKGDACSVNADCTSGSCVDNLCGGVGDNCGNPIVLTAGTSTVGWAATDVDYLTAPPSCNTQALDGPDIVMSYTATASSIVRYSFGKPASTRWTLVVSSGACGTLTPEVHCFSDYTPTALAGEFVATAGTTYYFYLRDTTSGTLPLSSPLEVTIEEFVPPCLPGSGGVVGSTMTRLPTTFPIATEYYMAADASPTGYVYIGGTTELHRMPKAGGASEDVELAATLTTTDLGYAMAIAGNDIFTIDDSTSSTSNRVVRISSDGGATWISGGEDYASFAPAPSDDFRGAVAIDGTLYLIVHDTSPTEIWSVPLGATTLPVAATLVGTIPFGSCSGLAADASSLYTACYTTDEIVRIDRATMASTVLVASDVFFSSTRNEIAVDDVDGDGAADVVYFNVDDEEIPLACDLASTEPYQSTLVTWGSGTSNYGFGFDPVNNIIYAFDDDDDELIIIQ